MTWIPEYRIATGLVTPYHIFSYSYTYIQICLHKLFILKHQLETITGTLWPNSDIFCIYLEIFKITVKKNKNFWSSLTKVRKSPFSFSCSPTKNSQTCISWTRYFQQDFKRRRYILSYYRSDHNIYFFLLKWIKQCKHGQSLFTI